LNVTVPVGGPPVEGVTVAVKVTGCPNTDVIALEVSALVVLVLTAFTVCVRGEDVLVLKFVAPP
jgi:hypothetical protein